MMLREKIFGFRVFGMISMALMVSVGIAACGSDSYNISDSEQTLSPITNANVYFEPLQLQQQANTIKTYLISSDTSGTLTFAVDTRQIGELLHLSFSLSFEPSIVRFKRAYAEYGSGKSENGLELSCIPETDGKIFIESNADERTIGNYVILQFELISYGESKIEFGNVSFVSNRKDIPVTPWAGGVLYAYPPQSPPGT